MKPICPEHGPMESCQTRYGILWICRADRCTVRQWNGSTSTPADEATRTARHELHTMFDPLWKDERGPFCRGKRKNKCGVRKDRAYWWLAESMGVPKEQAHFGMFNLEQCLRAKALILELSRNEQTVTVGTEPHCVPLTGQ